MHLPNVLLLLFEDNASHTRGTQQPVADVTKIAGSSDGAYRSCLDKYVGSWAVQKVTKSSDVDGVLTMKMLEFRPFKLFGARAEICTDIMNNMHDSVVHGYPDSDHFDNEVGMPNRTRFLMFLKSKKEAAYCSTLPRFSGFVRMSAGLAVPAIFSRCISLELIISRTL